MKYELQKSTEKSIKEKVGSLTYQKKEKVQVNKTRNERIDVKN